MFYLKNVLSKTRKILYNMFLILIIEKYIFVNLLHLIYILDLNNYLIESLFRYQLIVYKYYCHNYNIEYH